MGVRFLADHRNNANNGVAAAFGQGAKFFSCRIINSSATACYGFIREILYAIWVFD
jgi:hypothetical protein